MDETQDDQEEDQDIKTPDTETEETSEKKKPAPKKTEKLLSEAELQARLREAGRDDKSLDRRRKELDEREAKLKEAEWKKVTEKYGEEVVEKAKKFNIDPDNLTAMADLLKGVTEETTTETETEKTSSKKPTMKADSGKTTGGSEDFSKAGPDAKLKKGFSDLKK